MTSSTTFLDAHSRPWILEITVGAIARARAATGINLLDDLTATAKLLADDPLKLAELCYHLTGNQAAAYKIDTPADFLDCLAPESLPAMADAFHEALCFFFRRYNPKLGHLLTTATDRARSRLEQLSATLDNTITQERINRAIDAQIASAEAELRAAFGKQSTDSPAQSASTPDP